VRATNAVFLTLRRRLALECEAQAPYSGHVEIDESYFGPRRVRGKRERGASGKTIVFGIDKRNGTVHTQILPNVRRATLKAAVEGRITLDSELHSDAWHGYAGLVDMGYAKHYRLNHNANEFVRGSQHINGIESVWSFAKRRLAKFNGLHHHTFYLHLKETEWRFNHRRHNLYRELLEIFAKNPL
jgi:transposase-like protein